MPQARFLGFGNFSYQDEDAIHDHLLVLKSSIFPQNTAQEVHEGPVFLQTTKLDKKKSGKKETCEGSIEHGKLRVDIHGTYPVPRLRKYLLMR